MNKMGGMCLNWKVIAGLAVVGLGVWAVAPNLAGAALPFLIVLACPLSMLFMMRGMGGGQCATEGEQARRSSGVGLTRDEQVAELRAQMESLQAQQQAISRELNELEGARTQAPYAANDRAGSRS